jgi:hypothetical protein
MPILAHGLIAYPIVPQAFPLAIHPGIFSTHENQNLLKKRVDRVKVACYYSQAHLRAPNLENDIGIDANKRQSMNFE